MCVRERTRQLGEGVRESSRQPYRCAWLYTRVCVCVSVCVCVCVCVIYTTDPLVALLDGVVLQLFIAPFGSHLGVA